MKERGAEGGFDDPGEEGFAGDEAEDLAGETGGGEAGGDDGEDAVGGVLFEGVRFRYDEVWACHGSIVSLLADGRTFVF